MFYAFTISGSGTKEDPRIQRMLTKEKGTFMFLKIGSMSEERQEKIAAVYRTLDTAVKNAHKALISFEKGEVCLIFDSYTGKFYDINGDLFGTGRWGTSHTEADAPEEFWGKVNEYQARGIKTGELLGYKEKTK